MRPTRCPFCDDLIDYEATPAEAREGCVWVCPGDRVGGHEIYSRERVVIIRSDG